MDAGGDRLHPSNIAVIREVYDSEYSQHGFSMELEKALDARCSVIVIEPTRLGDETARWITFGNYLHRTAVGSGLTSIVTGVVWPDNILPQGSTCVISLLATALYTASWQFDHCVKYQVELNFSSYDFKLSMIFPKVERDPRKLARLPIVGALTTASPVVLVRKEDTRKKLLHCTVSLAAVAFCIYKMYRSIK